MRQVYFPHYEAPFRESWLKKWWWVALCALFLFAGLAGLLMLRSESSDKRTVLFEVKQGEGFRSIAGDLRGRELIRSKAIFEAYAYLTGAARHLKPGLYEFSPSMTSPEILGSLVSGISREAQVTIPEGSNIFEIDALLAANGVLPPGVFAAKAQAEKLEGYLFPDTYRFYLQSDPEDVFQKFTSNFAKLMGPILPEDKEKAKDVIIIASILEKEVPEMKDRQIVAGIIEKRIASDLPLQVDASVCYGKKLKKPQENCYPVTLLDTQMESPYNTYLHKGLPPGPIGNPGIFAVQAALSPVQSPYLYYLTDPVTKATIFSKTLSEHEANRSRYLFPTP